MAGSKITGTAKLRGDDRIALHELEAATKLYARYVELSGPPFVTSRPEPVQQPTPNWSSPLTLVLKR